MSFDSEKKTALSKQDKSAKGSIDSQIKQLCDLINRKPDYYTTSSCSGRIVLIKQAESCKKNECEWLFVSHETAGFSSIKSALAQLPDEEVWIRFESFILHIASRSIDSAEKLLRLVRRKGLKRAGIIALGSKVVLEIIGTEHMEGIVSKHGRMLIDDSCLNILVDKANERMERNQNNILRLVQALKNM